MAFIAQDLYLSSGLGSIQNSWNSQVNKFDTSTFYNWEQDNEPIYDLDERTSYLWEKIGYPIQNGFSGIPGKMYVVSGDAPFNGESSSLNGVPIFKHLSSVLEVLPNPLTFPAIIEVASFGSLGDLKLSNLKVDPNCIGAGLEIINRNFGRSSSFGGTIYTDSSTITTADIVGTLHQSSAISTSTTVASGFNDIRWNGVNRVWMTRSPDGSSTHVLTNTLLLGVNISNFDNSSNANQLRWSEYGNSVDPSIPTYDASTVRPVDSSVQKRSDIATGDSLHALIYGNYLSKVVVKNCGGPIYIRGFAVDGGNGTAGGLTHSTSAGFEIQNSNILIENCIAIRCSNYGFKIIDSEVNLSRAIGAGRCYDFNGTTAIRDNTKGVGIHATNSNLRVRADSYASGSMCLIQASRNSTGIELINSKISDGTSFDNITPRSRTYIQSFFNNNIGIDLQNSILNHRGHLEVFNNGTGLQAVNSKVFLPTTTIEYNQNIGINLKNSVIDFNPLLTLYNNFSTYGEYEQFHFNSNGQHIVCDNSLVIPTYASGMPNYYGLTFLLDSFGLTNNSGGTQLPSVEVKNGSKLELVHPICRTMQSNFTSTRPVFGACVAVKHNSTFKVKSSKAGAGIFIGPPSYTNQQFLSVLNADTNSIIEINGPTFVGQGGVDILAENQSTVKIVPHNANGDIDLTGWNLTDPYNHTRVELHSVRACLVANNNSTIQMEDLGDFNKFWGSSVSNNDFNDSDSLGLKTYASGGFCQFYPNGQDGTTVASLGTDNLGNVSFSPTTFNYAGKFLTDYTTTSIRADLSAVSTGGVCVKAANNSFVKVTNVHFPTGWYNTSGFWYDIASVNCDQLRIWNIAEGSHLEAAYCTVSGVYPSLAGYYGPSAYYTSGAGLPAYGVPNLPDTGTLSVLDQYGTQNGVIGTNYGPFRLYLSPASKAKMFCDAVTLNFGPPYQLWAQGYNVSGNVSSTASFSGVYSGINSSQFIHVSSLLDTSFRDRIRLDESAANMFANARHCASSKSGRHAVVTIYRAGTGLGGIGSDGGVATFGKGFKSADIFDMRRSN